MIQNDILFKLCEDIEYCVTPISICRISNTIEVIYYNKFDEICVDLISISGLNDKKMQQLIQFEFYETDGCYSYISEKFKTKPILLNGFMRGELITENNSNILFKNNDGQIFKFSKSIIKYDSYYTDINIKIIEDL